MKSSFLALVALILALTSTGSGAALNCKAATGSYAPVDETVNLGGATITVLEDVPVGTIVYQARYGASRFTGLTCSGPYNELKQLKVPFSINYETTPLPLSSWSHPSGGRVYQTGVPGLSMAVGFLDKNPAPVTHNAPYNFSDASEGAVAYTRVSKQSFYLTIIKTGPVAPGVINGADLASINITVHQVPGVSGLPIKVNWLRFSGQLKITAPTCKTPDVKVNLGTYSIPQTFKGKGSTTGWVTAPILFECPAIGFSGYYPGDNTSLIIQGGGTLPAGVPTNNQLFLALKPVNAVIDAANGIMAVDQGEDAATGVGIQIGAVDMGPDSSGNLSGTWFNDFNKKAVWKMRLEKYPAYWMIRARYIQTADKVTPGPANGKAVFTIEYK